MSTDNPPAFPNHPRVQLGDEYEGMSLRDWFAGQAMIGVAAYAGEPVPPDLLAKAAYGFADAMLAARGTQPAGVGIAIHQIPDAGQPTAEPSDAMVEAGVAAIREKFGWHGDIDRETVVTAYRAMLSASRTEETKL